LAGNVKLHVEPITTRGQSDQVIASLMSLIERGILKEGDVLPPERELAKQFNVGRNALREAIKVLEIYGLVGRKTKVGTVIRQTNLDYIISFAFSDLPATTRVFNEIK
jgi:GntR family transcriptional repressor for pyruvate dehydrogenase complex